MLERLTGDQNAGLRSLVPMEQPYISAVVLWREPGVKNQYFSYITRGVCQWSTQIFFVQGPKCLSYRGRKLSLWHSLTLQNKERMGSNIWCRWCMQPFAYRVPTQACMHCVMVIHNLYTERQLVWMWCYPCKIGILFLFFKYFSFLFPAWGVQDIARNCWLTYCYTSGTTE